MTTPAYPIPVTAGSVNANGLNISYVEAGQGSPLLLLHGGSVSNRPIWADHEYGWGGHLGIFAPTFGSSRLICAGMGARSTPLAV